MPRHHNALAWLDMRTRLAAQIYHQLYRQVGQLAATVFTIQINRNINRSAQRAKNDRRYAGQNS